MVNLNNVDVKEELLAEINFLKYLKNCERVIQMIDYEVKQDVQGLPFHDENEDQGHCLKNNYRWSKSFYLILFIQYFTVTTKSGFQRPGKSRKRNLRFLSF